MTKTKNRKVLMFIALTLSVLFIISYIKGNKDFKDFDYDILKSGDIVFTRGTSINSYVVLLFNRNTNDYSHCGIIYKEKNKSYIIHSTPTPVDTQKGRVVTESLDEFFHSNKVTLVSIFRLDNKYKENIGNALTAAIKYEKIPILFDDEFSLTNSKLYCTELIWKSFGASGLNLLDNSINNSILFPSDLRKSKKLKHIYTF